jgi:hypothetical protein
MDRAMQPGRGHPMEKLLSQCPKAVEDLNGGNRSLWPMGGSRFSRRRYPCAEATLCDEAEIGRRGSDF